MREEEVTYFQEHPYFSKLPSALFGISNLSKKLTTLLVRTVRSIVFSPCHLVFHPSICTYINIFFSRIFVSCHFSLRFLLHCGSITILFLSAF